MAGQTTKKVIRLIALLTLLAAVAALLLAGLAGKGYAWDLWHYRKSFELLFFAFFTAAGCAVVGMLVLVAGLWSKQGKAIAMALGGVVVGGGLAIGLVSMASDARSYVPIHDVATDLDDLPQFTHIQPRQEDDGRAPAAGRSDMADMTAEQRWRTYHEEAYGDLDSLRLSGSIEQVTQTAEAVAEEMGWSIALVRPEQGRLEATDTTGWFEFKDDVVVRVRSAGETMVEVDVRSVSRVGISDIGANAKRIRTFLDQLEQWTTQP